jgi:hypothetical protein
VGVGDAAVVFADAHDEEALVYEEATSTGLMLVVSSCLACPWRVSESVWRQQQPPLALLPE